MKFKQKIKNYGLITAFLLGIAGAGARYGMDQALPDSISTDPNPNILTVDIPTIDPENGVFGEFNEQQTVILSFGDNTLTLSTPPNALMVSNNTRYVFDQATNTLYNIETEDSWQIPARDRLSNETYEWIANGDQNVLKSTKTHRNESGQITSFEITLHDLSTKESSSKIINVSDLPALRDGRTIENILQEYGSINYWLSPTGTHLTISAWSQNDKYGFTIAIDTQDNTITAFNQEPINVTYLSDNLILYTSQQSNGGFAQIVNLSFNQVVDLEKQFDLNLDYNDSNFTSLQPYIVSHDRIAFAVSSIKTEDQSVVQQKIYMVKVTEDELIIDNNPTTVESSTAGAGVNLVPVVFDEQQGAVIVSLAGNTQLLNEEKLRELGIIDKSSYGLSNFVCPLEQFSASDLDRANISNDGLYQAGLGGSFRPGCGQYIPPLQDGVGALPSDEAHPWQEVMKDQDDDNKEFTFS